MTDNVRQHIRSDGDHLVEPSWGLLDALGSPGRRADVAERLLAEVVRHSIVEHDHDRVLARARELFPSDVAERWCRGSEPFLQGASPETVVASGFVDDVLAALDAIAAGALP